MHRWLIFTSAFAPSRYCICPMLASLRRPLSSQLGRVSFLTITALMPGLCFGALAWDTRKVELTAQPEDTHATAIFHFRNDGKEPVTITEIKPTCGCTTAELTKLTYAPGEAGEIKSVFTFGGATGQIEKTIQVATNDAPAQQVSLTLHVTIPELFIYSTRLLLWKMAEVPVEQSATITCLREVSGIELDPNSPTATTCRIDPVEAGKTYRISIRPKSSAQPITTGVSFFARFPDKTTRMLVIYVMVR